MLIETPAKIVSNPERFSEVFLKILDKKKELIPFRWNRAQRDFHQNRTGRDLILKARQLGFSTYVQGEMYRRTVTGTRTTITLAHDADTTQKLRRMADRFWQNCQFNGIQPARKYANATLTTYPEFDSTATIATAGSAETGRGDTYTDMHGSEVAFWPDAEKIIAGAMQGGSPDVILESTPNGAQGYFYERCMEALRNDGVWKLHFYPWWWDDNYRTDNVSQDFRYTEEEQRLTIAHKLQIEQILWRRSKIKELGRLFAQEYPEDPISCFLTSGNSYFGDLSDNFRAPIPGVWVAGHKYSQGLDFGQSNDYTAMPTIDKTSKQQVDLLHVRGLEWAEIRRRIKSNNELWSSSACKKGHISRGIIEICPLCNDKITEVVKPSIKAEKNSIGQVNIEMLQADGLLIIPFETTNTSKAEIMSDLHEGLHAGLQLQDYPVERHEINTFVASQTSTGLWRLAAEGDGHDDIVIGLALANYNPNIWFVS